MRSSFGISLLAHLGVLSLLLVSARLSANVEPRPVVYRVNLVQPRVEPEVQAPEPPPPEPPPSRPVPREVPELRVHRRQAREVRLTSPEAAPETPLRVEHRERRERRPEPPAPEPPPPTPPPEPEEVPPAAEEPLPRGASTQVQPDSPLFAEYAYYRVAMRNKISSLWSPPRASSELVCAVHFRIVRSGAIVGARIQQSSGLAFFDHTALRAVIEASPLPPLPAEFPDDVVGVTFQFAYSP
jgi:TonB family protein